MTVEPRTPERNSNSTSSARSTRATANSPPALTNQGTSKGSSSRTSLSSPVKSISSSATSASNIRTPCEVSNVPNRKRHWSRRMLSSMMKTFRSTNFPSPSFQSTSTKAISVTGSDTPRTPGPLHVQSGASRLRAAVQSVGNWAAGSAPTSSSLVGMVYFVPKDPQP